MRDGDERPDARDDETILASKFDGRMPERIGHYAIRGVIASGGMGTVFKAVQENPRRAVAIKVLKGGVNTASDLRRFEFEAQLLGRLRHPGIAQIFEAGTHEENGTSVPYFAMEYIPNAKSIIQHAADKELGTRERLEIFEQVCDAVHHGHQKGIIHRDLKPGNILVGPDGHPRVIDFGVARATDSDMALTMHQTDVGQLVGTVQYMSPEQCDADPHDIDTRSDVYSLGIVLYELLCGQLPYDVTSVPIFEATGLIRNSDPPKPSKINPKLRGDLETIVMKALEKDRDRRYRSASELSQDLRRYLNGDAITARPASSTYQLRVFARRNRGLLAAVSAVVTVLVAGAIVSSTLYFRSREYQLEIYEQQAKAQGAQNYLQDVMQAIGTSMGDQIPVSKLLKTFGDNIEERFADQPEVEAEVRFGLASGYNYLSMYYGGSKAGQFTAMAEQHLNAALRIHRELYGEQDSRTLATIEDAAGHLGKGFDLNGAIIMRKAALRIRQAADNPDVEGIMVARYDLAAVLVKNGLLAEAEAHTAAVVEYFESESGPDDPATRAALSLRASIRLLQGKTEEALADRLHLLEAARRVSGVDSDEEAVALQELAYTYVCMGALDEAEAIYDEPQELSEEALGLTKWLIEENELQPMAATVVVFWESWCPYCQLYLPKLDDARVEVKGSLQVVGMTSLNSGMHEDDAVSFVERNRLTFPSAVYDGKVFEDLGFDSWPAALAMKDGKILWKGHPQVVNAAFMEGLAGE